MQLRKRLRADISAKAAPRGSRPDADSIAVAHAVDVAMLFDGVRHLRH